MQLMAGDGVVAGRPRRLSPRGEHRGGCRHLRHRLDRYAGSVPLALAAYNAGPELVDAAGGIPPIAETHEYL